MTEQEMKERLCWYDPRNPWYVKPEEGDEVTEPRRRVGGLLKCSCDACFYGTDRLATTGLELLSALGEVLQHGLWREVETGIGMLEEKTEANEHAQRLYAKIKAVP